MNADGRAAVFLDRDGTVIADPGYLRDPKQVELLPGAAGALAAIAARGHPLILVSNQSGIGRGLITAQEAHLVDRRFADVLAQAGVRLEATYYCPHTPDDGCACRKPQPGMLLDAAREHGIDLTRSIMVGNAESDVGAGRSAGTYTILFRARETPAAQTAADAVAGDWDEVRELVLARPGGSA
jgi:histidinol-phosphate phosphatase family protein